MKNLTVNLISALIVPLSCDSCTSLLVDDNAHNTGKTNNHCVSTLLLHCAICPNHIINVLKAIR